MLRPNPCGGYERVTDPVFALDLTEPLARVIAVCADKTAQGEAFMRVVPVDHGVFMKITAQSGGIFGYHRLEIGFE